MSKILSLYRRSRQYASRTLLFIMAVLLLASLAGSSVSAIVCTTPDVGDSSPECGVHDASWVNSYVEWKDGATSAQSKVVDWEDQCTQEFSDNKATMTTSTEREIVNASAYIQSTWLTRANDPNNNSSQIVPAGTTSLDMQINQMVFLCAILTMNASGFGIASDHKVTNSNYANDRDPVPDKPDDQYKINQASRYESNAKITSLTVVRGGGSVSNNPAGQTLGYKRNFNSRYWRAEPVPFTYDTPSPLTPGNHTITLDLGYKYISTYHDYGSAGTSRCSTDGQGDGATVAYGNFSSCYVFHDQYTFNFKVPADGAAACGGMTSTPAQPQPGEPITKLTTKINVTNTPNNPGTQTGTITVKNGSGATVRSSPITYTPTGGGSSWIETANYVPPSPIVVPSPSNTYTVTWTFPDPALSCSAPLQAMAKPYLQVYGGDVSAGSGPVDGGTCANNSHVPSAGIASWNKDDNPGYSGAGTQFGAQALAVIEGFASAQHNQPGNAAPASGLTLANFGVPLGTDIFGGNFGAVPGCENYETDMNSANTTTADVTTINATSVAAGQHLVRYVKGNVHITGNITYAPYSTLADIPSYKLVVIGGNIYIDPGVTQLDGLYVAEPSGATGGVIYTCDGPGGGVPNFADGSLYGNCNGKQLVVNGSFVAKQVQFLRSCGSLIQAGANDPTAANFTGGADAVRCSGTNHAAEIFNYSPEMWLGQPGLDPAKQYDSIMSLPPVL